MTISEISVTAANILQKIEYSISMRSWQFLKLTAIYFAVLFFTFLITSWVSITITRSIVFGKAAMGPLNYINFDLSYFSSVISYWQSSYPLDSKIENVLYTPILVIGSYDPVANVLTGGLQMGLGLMASLVSMALLVATFTHVWLLSRKCCTINAVAKGTSAVSGGGGIGGGIFSMFMLAGCCGGTGMGFCLMTLPLIGGLFGSIFVNANLTTILAFSIPINAMMVGMIFFMTKKIPIGTFVDKSKMPRPAMAKNLFKAGLYLLVPAILIPIFAIQVYYTDVISNELAVTGITAGVTSFNIGIYTTYPLTSFLFLMSGFILLHRTFKERKLIATTN